MLMNLMCLCYSFTLFTLLYYVSKQGINSSLEQNNETGDMAGYKSIIYVIHPGLSLFDVKITL